MRDKKERFQDLAEKRVNRAIEAMRLLGNLSNENNYVYSDDDVKKIFTALEAELRLLRSKFANARPKKDKFTLK